MLPCDIHNAYLTVPFSEKVRTKSGSEFGLDAGNVMIIVRAFYGIRSVGASFIAFLAETLYDIGYVLSMAYPDMWMMPAIKDDGFQ